MTDYYFIAPQISDRTGWGVHMHYLALAIEDCGVNVIPMGVPLLTRSADSPHEWRDRALQAVKAKEEYQRSGYPWPVFYAGGNSPGQALHDLQVKDSDTLCMVFENPEFSENDLSAMRAFDKVFCVSQWNTDVLREHGIDARYAPLGVDTAVFSPEPWAEAYPGRYVIFSGGKVELRKGQDIVLAAFKVFQQRHPEALLLTVWDNLWPTTMQTMKLSPYGVGVPPMVGRSVDVKAWAGRIGIPRDSVERLAMMPHFQLPQALRGVHCAVFPNRCEGGTNMVAMECLSMGIPTILSACGGHQDLGLGRGWWPSTIDRVAWWLFDLTMPQSLGMGETVATCGEMFEKIQCGESSIDELLKGLEFYYQNRTATRPSEKWSEWDWNARLPLQLDVMGIKHVANQRKPPFQGVERPTG